MVRVLGGLSKEMESVVSHVGHRRRVGRVSAKALRARIRSIHPDGCVLTLPDGSARCRCNTVAHGDTPPLTCGSLLARPDGAACCHYTRGRTLGIRIYRVGAVVSNKSDTPGIVPVAQLQSIRGLGVTA